MPDVEHRSLIRRLEIAYFAGSETWTKPQDVNEKAAREFDSGGKDPHTSLWDEGEQRQTREDAVLGILLSRPSIKKIGVGTLWQDELPTCGARVVQKDGDTDYIPAIRLHFQLRDPRASDYIEMALAAGKRNDFEALTEPEVTARLEDAYFAGKFDVDKLRDRDLKKVLKDRLKSRYISAAEAAATYDSYQVYDGRAVRDDTKLRDAIEVNLAEILAMETPLLPNVRKNVPILLYCENGTASRSAARTLRVRYGPLKVLEYGYESWVTGQFATVKRA